MGYHWPQSLSGLEGSSPTERHMRLKLIVILAATAGLVAASAPGQAAPGPVLAATPAGAGSLIENVQLFPRRYYRLHPYAAPGAVVAPVVPAVPVVTAPAPVPGTAVEGAPAVVMVPARPASCGEFRYWNGVACVDARLNNPYIGPR
jgi:hypothetical protein